MVRIGRFELKRVPLWRHPYYLTVAGLIVVVGFQNVVNRYVGIAVAFVMCGLVIRYVSALPPRFVCWAYIIMTGAPILLGPAKLGNYILGLAVASTVFLVSEKRSVSIAAIIYGLVIIMLLLGWLFLVALPALFV